MTNAPADEIAVALQIAVLPVGRTENLCVCPNSIIMEKGPEELKRQVMMVTDDAENDGIYKAMVKLGKSSDIFPALKSPSQ